jgi:hypothetical protein
MLACNGSDTNEETATGHLERGDVYSENEQWDEAIAEYGEAIELDPDLMVAYVGRATAYSMKEQYGLAVADLDRVIEESTDQALVERAEQLADELRPRALRRTLDEIASQVVEIRELTPEDDVEFEFFTTDELRGYLIEEFEEDYPEEEVEVLEEVLALLDLMPEDPDLRSLLLDVFSEQILGFYDDDTKEFYVVSDSEGLDALDKVTFAHEYTHALQDLHFNLGSLPLDVEDESDVALAALALVEGDAMLVTANYVFQKLSADEQREFMEGSTEADSGILESAPRFIQEELGFPYERGAEFVMQLERWDGINQAYEDPPRSTEQIIHPEKYLERDDPQEVSLPDLEAALGEGWSQLDTDILGEFYVGVYLETFLTEETAGTAAAGWDGDRYVYLKNTDGDKVLAWRTTWDSSTDADEYFDACVAFVAEKSEGAWNLCLDEDQGRLWSSEDQGVYLGASGSDALLVVASDADIARTVAAEFPEFPEASSACP